MNKIFGIYKITSPTNKVYIGQSWDIKTRWRDYKHISKSQRVLYRSFKKYGLKSHKFKIIHELPSDVSQEVLDRYEILYWGMYKGCKVKMLNCKEPGRRGRLSEEGIEKMRKSLKGRKVWNDGIKMSPLSQDHKNKIKSALKGKMTKNIELLHSKIIREKARLSNKGKKHNMSKDDREKLAKMMTNNNYGAKNKGVVRTQENKDRISATLKLRQDNKGASHPNSKLTEGQILEIRKIHSEGEFGCRKLSSWFGVSKTNILDIINRRTWKSI